MEIIKISDIEKIKNIDYMGLYVSICKTEEMELNLISKLQKLNRSCFDIIIEIEEGLKVLSRKIKYECNLINHSYESLIKAHSLIILNEEDYLKLKDDR